MTRREKTKFYREKSEFVDYDTGEIVKEPKTYRVISTEETFKRDGNAVFRKTFKIIKIYGEQQQTLF